MSSWDTGERLRIHADMETEEAALPYRTLPEYQIFDRYWSIILGAYAASNKPPPLEEERRLAEHWYIFGVSVGKNT